MAILVLFVSVVLALGLLVLTVKVESVKLKGLMGIGALAIVLLGALLASIRFVSANEVGIISKNAFGANLKNGQIIATNGEMGVQANVLAPGWHFGYWPFIYSVKSEALTQIKNDEVGLIEAADGTPLTAGQLFAPEFSPAEFQKMLDAEYFLTTGKGSKGKQTSVLTPGTYRLNTALYKIHTVKQTEVLAGEVAVLKSNFGTPATMLVKLDNGIVVPVDDKTPDEAVVRFARTGEMGVLGDPLPPGKYALNTDAFTVTVIWTTEMPAHYTRTHAGTLNAADVDARRSSTPAGPSSGGDDREINVITSDGFRFPVDVSVTYSIPSSAAAYVVAKLGDDEGDRFKNALNSAVRSVFRNNAEKVKALDYVNMRSTQESQSLLMLTEEMSRYGVKVASVRIRDVGGDQKTIEALLKTQTDREIAKQELITFKEQEKTAEQKKTLTKVTQESEEERKLATAAYSVKIATEEQKRKLVEAEAEAQSTTIKALAQAKAYESIAKQIGKSNAALMEVLKIIGEKNIVITPRIMMNGSGVRTNASAGAGDAEMTALIGTMLDSMMSREEDKEAAKSTVAPKSDEKK